MANALSRRPVSHGASLVVMGIQYNDRRADVSNRELIAMMARLAITPTMLNQSRHAQDEDELSDNVIAQRAHLGLTRDSDEFVRMRGWLYVLELPAHLGI